VSGLLIDEDMVAFYSSHSNLQPIKFALIQHSLCSFIQHYISLFLPHYNFSRSACHFLAISVA